MSLQKIQVRLKLFNLSLQHCFIGHGSITYNLCTSVVPVIITNTNNLLILTALQDTVQCQQLTVELLQGSLDIPAVLQAGVEVLNVEAGGGRHLAPCHRVPTIIYKIGNKRQGTTGNKCCGSGSKWIRIQQLRGSVFRIRIHTGKNMIN